MRRYRFFLLNVTGKVEEEREFQAPDDLAAIANAERLRNGRPAELWNTHQRITRWR